MTRHASCWSVALVCGTIFLCLEATALGQQSNSAAASAPPSPTASSETTVTSPAAPISAGAKPDLGAQIDELIRQSNEQMNVKGQFGKAAELAQQAFDLSKKPGDKGRTLEAMMSLASAYYFQGRMQEALELSKEVAALAKEVGNQQTLSHALNRIAAVLGELGRFEESLSYLYQSMDVAREQRDQTMQHIVLINIGELYIRVGDPDKAEEPLLESLRIARELKSSGPGGNPSKKATELSLKFLGEMEAAREHYKLALAYLRQVRESRPESEQSVIGLLDTMAAIYQRIGEPQTAVELLDEARERAKKSGSVSHSITLADLGVSQESLGQLNEALASENLALAEVRKDGGNADYEWQIERHIGHIDQGLGRNEEALIHYRNSIHAIERLRASALNTELGKAGFTNKSRSVYAEVAELLVALGRDSEAFEMAERGRARAFLDTLAVTREGLPEELTPEQNKRENALLEHISGIQKELWKEGISNKEEQQKKAELAAAEDDLEAFHVEVRRANPHYASIRYPEPVSVQSVQGELLESKTTLVEFLLGEKRSLAWVVSKNKVTIAVLAPRKQIEDQVLAYRKALTNKASALTLASSFSEIERQGKALYTSLFSTITRAIPAGNNLLIVPDGMLGYLPFETLVAGTKRESSGETRPLYLLDKFSIAYAPSASALAAVKSLNQQRSEWPKTLLAFGDPITDTHAQIAKAGVADAVRSAYPQAITLAGIGHPDAYDAYAERGFALTRLPFTREEILGISNLFPEDQRQIYLGDQATEEAVKHEKLNQYRYIHFASHGFIDETVPGRSGILFSRDPSSREDGILQTGEIMRLKLNADLVTLSACSTGLGKLVNGEGILGVTRAFFYSGAQNVSVSLWNVNDSATSALMKAFYARLNQGVPKGQALRQAKLSLLHDSNVQWHHPYFWAAFVLVGQGQ